MPSHDPTLDILTHLAAGAAGFGIGYVALTSALTMDTAAMIPFDNQLSRRTATLALERENVGHKLLSGVSPFGKELYFVAVHRSDLPKASEIIQRKAV